ncbi:MAG: hypothetical protein IPJ41_02110 [Phycisphaerales bacterium]|nr:hypothetical protein [Phycisphaerales bacterium]
MSSEMGRGARRIASNYVRLFLSVGLGIALVPILMGGVGLEGFGLWGLIGATIGFSDLFRELVRASMNRELGSAYHSADPSRFPIAYNSAIVVALLVSVPALLVYVVLFLVLPVLNIDPLWIGAARQVVLNQAIYSFAIIVTAPQLNMFLVSERYTLYNFWLILDRASYFISAVAIFRFFPPATEQQGLEAFSLVGALIAVGVAGVAVVWMLVAEPRCRPRPALVSRGEIRAILGTTGWNAIVGLALNLHIRFDQLIMNIAFGTRANAIFSVGVRLTGYVRMLAVGMTDGLDVVGARMGERADGSSLARMMKVSTKLHALVVLPASVVVWLMAEPLLRLWIGKHLDPDDMRQTIGITHLLVIGFAARGISDCWIRTLYGAGHIRRYAPVILAGGLTNPLLAVLLVYVLPAPTNFYAPAITYALIFVAVHLLTVPFIAAKCVDVTAGDLLGPLVRPGIVTLVCAAVIPLGSWWLGTGSLVRVAAIMAAFGALFGIAALAFALSAQERRLLLRFATGGRLGRAAPQGVGMASSTSTAE